MLQNFIIIIVYLLIGIILRRLPDFSKDTAKVLNLFAIYVSMPALILLRIPTLTFSNKVLVPLVMPWAALVFSAVVILTLSRALGWGRQATGCLLLLVPLGNTSFFGIPMVRAFFGDPAVAYALLYDQFGSFLALGAYGSVILTVYSAGQTRLRIGTILKKIILFPPFIALVLALAARWVTIPAVLTGLFSSLAATLIPLVMIAVGLQLSLRLDRESISHLGIGLGVKLALVPLAAWMVCHLMGLKGEAVRVSIFESGMPPMVTAGALAVAADLSPTLAAAMVGVGLLASCITLPLLRLLL